MCMEFEIHVTLSDTEWNITAYTENWQANYESGSETAGHWQFIDQGPYSLTS